MQIAIVDDLIEERKLLRQRLENELSLRHLHAEITEFENGEDFLHSAKTHPFSVLFLDIYMEGLNGIDTAKELRTFDKDCILIFTTTSTDHALDGFRVRALHYLVKPYTENEIHTLIDEILTSLPAPDKYLDVQSNGSNVRIFLNDIVYAEHFPHKMLIKSANGKELFTRQTFGEFTASLKEDARFFICSRGVIINLEHVSDFKDNSFLMDDGNMITVSRALIKSARQVFMDYLFQRRMH